MFYPKAERLVVVENSLTHALVPGISAKEGDPVDSSITRDDLIAFLRQHRLAVQASRAPSGAPQAAVVGFAVTDELEIVFDTIETSRKYENLRDDPRVALVVGWDAEVTTQLEGRADFPQGSELERIRERYLQVFPDGRQRLAWPGIAHVRVRLDWARYSDFTQDPPRIVEIDF